MPTSPARADCECGDGETCYWVAPADGNCDVPTATGEYDHPYCGIQNALRKEVVVTGDVLLALPGEYYEQGIDFRGKGIYLRSCAGPEATLVIADMSAHVFQVLGGGDEDDVIIEGFTITRGADTTGGGIIIAGASPTIRGNIITDNSAERGGGICCSGNNTAPLIIDNVISYNVATSEGGGGIYSDDYSSPTIAWCAINCNNSLLEISMGGGIHIAPSSDVRITHCVISDNVGGAGGGISSRGSFRVEPERAIECEEAEEDRTPIIDNCLIVRNAATHTEWIWGGGGLHFNTYAQPTIVNCTVSDNYAVNHGGGMSAYFACVRIDNSIFWGNTADGSGDEVYVTNGSDITFTYSDLQGGEAGVGIGYAPASILHINDQSGNIGHDIEEHNPEFRDSAACDYHLTNGSPCIDSADDLSVLPDDLDLDGDGIEGEPTPVDLDDRPRFVGVVDMGTYELGTQGCPEATIAASDPPDGTIDARQPHPIDDSSCGAWQGIGSAAEPIVITLSPVGGAADPECWALCETDTRGCEPNSIESVEYLGSEDYRLILVRPITPGAVTTIQYLRHEGYVTYIAHPANVDESGVANANDITALIDCLLAPGTCTEYQEDVDHSGTVNANDITVLIDLLNGAQEFDPWYGTLLPEVEECPSGVVCGCEEGEGSAPEGGGDGGSEEGADRFAEGFVVYLTNVNLEDPVEAECFPVIVAQLCDMSFRVLSVVEGQELGRSLLDPELTFVTPWVEFLVPDIVAFLQSSDPSPVLD